MQSRSALPVRLTVTMPPPTHAWPTLALPPVLGSAPARSEEAGEGAATAARGSATHFAPGPQSRPLRRGAALRCLLGLGIGRVGQGQPRRLPTGRRRRPGPARDEPAAGGPGHRDHVEDEVAAPGQGQVRCLPPATQAEEAARQEWEEAAGQRAPRVRPTVDAAPVLRAGLAVDQHEDRGVAEREADLADALVEAEGDVSPESEPIGIRKKAIDGKEQIQKNREPHPGAVAPVGPETLDAPRIGEGLRQEDARGGTDLQAAEALWADAEALQRARQGQGEDEGLQPAGRVAAEEAVGGQQLHQPPRQPGALPGARLRRGRGEGCRPRASSPAPAPPPGGVRLLQGAGADDQRDYREARVGQVGQEVRVAVEDSAREDGGGPLDRLGQHASQQRSDEDANGEAEGQRAEGLGLIGGVHQLAQVGARDADVPAEETVQEA
mmetsp:Transcript_133839/g.416288  ORF Transcript_133839/g.416288 Transcript_133839/m.416288 type:complete len:438 (+) Transcript_133839:140-1453(+)